MIALILWWVYCEKPISAAMVGAGLICSVTRAAWLGTALAVFVLAVKTKQWKRLAIYSGVAAALFLLSIPIVGLGEYLASSGQGQDESAQLHRASIISGIQIMAEQPFGASNKSVGARVVDQNSNATWVETTYLSFGAEYGIVAALCFLGFFISALVRAWHNQTKFGFAALGILVGLGFMMTVLLMHLDRRLSCWAWLPIGMAMRDPANSWLPTPAEETKSA
jgi:hypothetical protein